jgi:import inner membrane translocase subunit TIM10
MAEQEMAYRVELFNKCVLGPTCAQRYLLPFADNLSLAILRMVGNCYDKCIDRRYKDGDLSVGENTCLDRCSSKYWACTSIVGQLLGASQGR